MRTGFAAALVVLAAASTAVQAQEEADASAGVAPTTTSINYLWNDYIAVLPGFAMPDRRLGVQRRGFTTSFLYGYQFGEHFSVEGQVQGSTFQRRFANTTDFYQWGGAVDAVWSLFDRRRATVTPFVLGGVGADTDDVFPPHRKVNLLLEGGLGLVTKPLFHGIKFRIEGRYNRDFLLGGLNDYRALAGVEIPLGRVYERSVAPPVEKVVVREVIKEVPVQRPWVDSDGDGVDDEHDLCPDTPHGMKVDATGCIIPGQIYELNGVSFEFNSTRLTANSQTILNSVVKAFIGQPSLKVEVAGHSDSIGNATYNLHLSQRRAEAVRTYLIGRGVKPDQLTAKGYGKTQPKVSPEKTAEDRERNRRVEFRVTGR